MLASVSEMYLLCYRLKITTPQGVGSIYHELLVIAEIADEESQNNYPTRCGVNSLQLGYRLWYYINTSLKRPQLHDIWSKSSQTYPFLQNATAHFCHKKSKNTHYMGISFQKKFANLFLILFKIEFLLLLASFKFWNPLSMGIPNLSETKSSQTSLQKVNSI